MMQCGATEASLGSTVWYIWATYDKEKNLASQALLSPDEHFTNSHICIFWWFHEQWRRQLCERNGTVLAASREILLFPRFRALQTFRMAHNSGSESYLVVVTTEFKNVKKVTGVIIDTAAVGLISRRRL